MRARSIVAVAVVLAPLSVAGCFVGGTDDLSCECPDDGHACTEDHCVDGECVHDLVTGRPADSYAGECLTYDCQGGLDPVTVPNDQPPDDYDACTVDSCTPDGAVHSPMPVGSPCGQNAFCDTAGN